MLPPEPPYARLRSAILDLFHETVSRYPSPYAPGAEPVGPPPYRLGEYLIYQGYLSPRELRAALQESQGRDGQRPVPLGLTLCTRYRVPVRVIAMTLLLQALDHFTYTPDRPPRFLGELLLRKAILTPDQLAVVLEEQALTYARGRWVRIGDLITSYGWLDPEALTANVRQLSLASLSAAHGQRRRHEANADQELTTIIDLLSSPPAQGEGAGGAT